ncbi:PAS domain S-box protein [Halapricum salinum]|uniref:histidine kinase n=1 Tax=Halapricum salinum TaxID=1457250 RepID=A0A4D6HEH8_9EURY|nr:PAS domain S-box protein [Halapricum salinum]QCC51961.1 hybrid sensor histidine kinase/response regulator [Halapricum salinum]
MSSADGQPIRVLHVDDEPDFADLVATYLQRSHDDIRVETATDAAEGLDALAETPVDCIVSDHDMPGMDGLDFLRAVRDENPDLPFILFTGKGNEEIASDAISAGVTEYLQKGTGTDQYAVLANRIERAVGEYRAKNALEESERMLSTLISNLPGMAYRCLNEPGWPMEFVSDGCRELTGYDSAALVDGSIVWGEDVLIDDDRDELWETVQAALDAGDPFEVTYRIETADGERKWVWEQGRGVYDDGELTALEGIILDVDTRLIDPADRQIGRTLAENVTGRERILERVGDGFLALDDAWTITYANDRAAALVGRDTESLVGQQMWDVFPEGVGSDFEEQYVQAMETQRPAEFEAYYDPLDSWFEVRAFPGEHGLSIYFRDVTERREREDRLERYRTLVENVGDPMYVLDYDGTITMANQAMADHLGYDRDEIVGTHATRFMSEADIERGTDLLLDLMDSDRTWATFEMETIHADGTRTINEDKIAALTDQGEFVGSVGVIRDITERKARERELERYETIIQTVEDPVYALDAEGRFAFVNEAVEPMTGYTPAELVGESVTTLVAEDDYRAGVEMVQTLLEEPERTYVTYEIDLHTKDGDTVAAENHIALLPPDEDEFTGTAGVIRDITERKQRERRLEEFASVVSHDLQSPLNVITGRAELALDTGDLGHVENILDAADRMEALIEGLLTLARQGEVVGDVEETSLSTLTEQAWKQVQTAAASIDLRDDRSLEADPDRLRELLENLFSNAVTHAGEDVTVSVGTTDSGFYVADDGEGIPADRRSKVFEHGHSTSEEGTGLGLTIVARIADAHGWDVTVTDSSSGGARFEFSV